MRQSTGGLSTAPPLPPVAADRQGSHWTFPCEDCVRQVLGRGTPDATLRSHSDLEAPGLLGFGVLPPTFYGVNFVQLKRNKVAFSWKKEKKKTTHPLFIAAGLWSAEMERLFVYASCVLA